MNTILAWFTDNSDVVFELVMALIIILEIVVNLTPSDKDNSILLKIKNVIAFLFPNRRKGGGKHES
tara:strand:- start:264 stop:461 length:198 start_codon:yes stop_codon:yes gene_type:complete